MEPTQIEYPWRATARTIFQAFVGLCALVPLLVGTDTPPVGAVAVALTVSAAVTRIMAMPQVNDWISATTSRGSPLRLSDEAPKRPALGHRPHRRARPRRGRGPGRRQPTPQRAARTDTFASSQRPGATSTGHRDRRRWPRGSSAPGSPRRPANRPEQLPPDVQAQPDAGAPALVVETPPGSAERSRQLASIQGQAAPQCGLPLSIRRFTAPGTSASTEAPKVYAARTRSSSGAMTEFATTPAVAPTPSAARPITGSCSAPRSTASPASSTTSTSRLGSGQQARRSSEASGSRSGNTGNSTGDHLHLSASTSPWSCGKITQARADSIRYRYLSAPARGSSPRASSGAFPSRPGHQRLGDRRSLPYRGRVGPGIKRVKEGARDPAD